MICICTVLVLFESGVVFADSLEDLVDAERAAALRTQGIITEVQPKNPAPALLPRQDELRRFVSEQYSSLDPSVCVETLFRYEKPPQPADGRAADTWTQTERAGLFNQIVALSTLTGIQYYSESRGAMRTLYEYSTVVDSKNTKKTIPDPVYAAPPQGLTLYARQKDLTFGENIYRYEYHTTPDALFFSQENITTLSVGIIPAVGKNKLRSVFAIIDCGDSLLIYITSMAKTASLPGIGERVGYSFTSRAEAILKWFTERANGVLKK